MLSGIQDNNEKGGVENLAGFVERNFFTPEPEAKTWAEMNALLADRCLKYARIHKVPVTKITVEEAWQVEKKHLLPLPKRQFDCCRHVEVSAAKNQLLRFENNFYSVPQAWVGRPLILKSYVHWIEIYSSRLMVARHLRSYASGEETYDLDHYLETLYAKPRALEDSKPFKRARLPAIYQKYLDNLKVRHRRPEKEFVQILMLHRETSWEALTGALAEALKQGVYQADGVRQILEKMTGKHIMIEPLPADRQSHLAGFKVQRPRVSKFDLLLGQPGVTVH